MLSSFNCGGSKWWIKVTSSPTAHFLESSVHRSIPGALVGSPLLLKAKETLPLIGFDTVWPFSSTAFQPTRLPASAVVRLLTDGPAECSLHSTHVQGVFLPRRLIRWLCLQHRTIASVNLNTETFREKQPSESSSSVAVAAAAPSYLC